MWSNFKRIANVAATIGGLIFMWETAVSFARAKVEDEIRSGMYSVKNNVSSNTDNVSDGNVEVTREGDTIKIRIHQD